MDVMFPRLRSTLATLQQSLAFILFVAMSATAAESSQPADCVRQDVTFDGIAPLTHATVTPDATSRVGLHRDYPQDCNPACASKAYLVEVPQECWQLPVGKGFRSILQRPNIAASAACRDAAAKTKKEQHCTVVVPDPMLSRQFVIAVK
jgi:hypothetical protein